MQHPNKDAIYCLSYPRSGSTWFRYCFKYITETNIDKELLFHSHRKATEQWSVEGCFDIKNILLLRNYKEAIFSEMKSVYRRPHHEMNQKSMRVFKQPLTAAHELLLFTSANTVEIMKYMATEFDPTLLSLAPDDWTRLCDAMHNNPDHAAYQNPALKAMMTNIRGPDPFRAFHDFASSGYYSMKPDMDKIFGDFVLSDFPLFDSDYVDIRDFLFPVENVEIPRYPMESVLSVSASNHYHFALQLVRYYELLEYHDRVFKANPNNALLVKYEDFIKEPFTELSKVVDFMEQTSLATSEHAAICKNNLHRLVGDIEQHKAISVTKYRAPSLEEGRDIALSYGRDPEYNFHSSICRKEFLTKIDNVLKNKNLELYNQYLSDYEEKVA